MRTSVGWFSSPSCALIYQWQSMSPSTPPWATPSARSFGSGSMRSSTARKRSCLTTSCCAPSRTCWRAAALAT
eukprot:1523282-Pleurochrysis_carterae.AAC.1